MPTCESPAAMREVRMSTTLKPYLTYNTTHLAKCTFIRAATVQ